MRVLTCAVLLLPALTAAQFIEETFPAPCDNISGLGWDGLVWAVDSVNCVLYGIDEWTGEIWETITLAPLPGSPAGLAVNDSTFWFAQAGTAVILQADWSGSITGSWDLSGSGICTISGLSYSSYLGPDGGLYVIDSADRTLYSTELPLGSEPVCTIFTIADDIAVFDIGCDIYYWGAAVACSDLASPVRFYSGPSSYQVLGYGTYESASGVSETTWDGRIYFSDPLMGAIHRYCPHMGGIPEDTEPLDPAPAGIYPNPARDPAVLALILDRESAVTVRIFDLSGREVWSTGEIALSAGAHQITLETGEPGVYLCRITSGGAPSFVRFVVTE